MKPLGVRAMIASSVAGLLLLGVAHVAHCQSDLIAVTVETVDTSGQHVPGEVAVLGHSDAYTASPYSFEIPNGASIERFYGRYLGKVGTHGPLTLHQGVTYAYDTVTATLSQRPSDPPDETRIQIVFDPMTVVVETVDTSGQALPGDVAVLGYFDAYTPSPHSFQIANGGRIERFYGRYPGKVGTYGPLALHRGVTYAYDAVTATLSERPSDLPHETRIQIIFDPVEFTIETVDVQGNPIPGKVAVRPFGPNENSAGPVYEASPQSYSVASGGTIPTGYFWSFAGYYGLLEARHAPAFNLWRDHTYSLDSRTGEFTDTLTPGQTRIRIIFDPVEFTIETLDAQGDPIPGKVAVRPFGPNENSAGPQYEMSPQTYSMASGGKIPTGSFDPDIRIGLELGLMRRVEIAGCSNQPDCPGRDHILERQRRFQVRDHLRGNLANHRQKLGDPIVLRLVLDGSLLARVGAQGDPAEVLAAPSRQRLFADVVSLYHRGGCPCRLSSGSTRNRLSSFDSSGS